MLAFHLGTCALLGTEISQLITQVMVSAVWGQGEVVKHRYARQPDPVLGIKGGFSEEVILDWQSQG